jgi:hypothetical protein
MRGGLADLIRVWRAMNAIPLGGEVDPDDTHGIVRPGGQVELFLHVDTTQVKRRIIVINWVLGDFGHLELAFR